MRATRDGLTADRGLAIALAVASQLEIWAPRLVPGVGEVVGDRLVLTVTALAATLPLAARRRHPLPVLLVVMAALALQQLLTTPTDGLVLLLAGMIAAYSSSAYSSDVQTAAYAGMAIVAGAALIGRDAGDWAFITVVFGGAWLVGFVVLQRSTELTRAREDNLDLSGRLADAARQLAETQAQLARGPVPEDLAALTAREVEVVRTIAAGMSNSEIAAELYISEWTVKTHVGSILRKLGLRDRAQIVIAAYEAGLVHPRASAD
jgi:DNA-binding CsgD family transcriptional regulator